MWPNLQSPADLVTFTEEILNGKLRFLCSVLFFPCSFEHHSKARNRGVGFIDAK